MQARSSAFPRNASPKAFPAARSFAAAAIESAPARRAADLVFHLAPLWLAVIAHAASTNLWGDLVQSLAYAPRAQRLAWSAWPTMQLSGSLALLASAVLMNYTQAAGRLAVVSALAGLVVAVVLTGLPEFDRLTAGASAMPWPKRLAALDVRFAIAGAVGLFAFAAGVRYLRGPGSRIEPLRQRSIERASSDNFGHADWMEIDEALRLFNAARTPKGGIVLGEAYRVDRDAVADRRFDPRDRSSWGLGGRTSLLVLDLTPDTSHGLVFAGSGGFKTVSVCVPALLTYRGPAVVLDPTGELSSMLTGARERMSRRVVAIDPEARDPVGFNVLDWIDVTGPSADADIRSVVDWICGERPPDSQRGISGSSAFFEGRGKALVEALLSDLLFDPHLRPGERTLKGLAPRLALPEREMRKELARIHAGSTSAKARHIAGQLKELVDETFSGVYGNMSEQTEWLANVRYASLVSGNSFRTRDLASGKLDIFLNLSLKVMAATPALARCIVGALLNGVYEAKGRVEGRVLFLLDEAARLGFMSGLSRARDASRKYGITLVLIYQSEGQLVEQWGEAGRGAWFESATWRSYSAVSDAAQAERISKACGEYGIVTRSKADGSGISRRQPLQIGTRSRNESETRAESRRRLITADEILHDMRTDDQIVFLRGLKPLRCGRAIYFRRPDMASAVGANPFSPATPAPRVADAPEKGRR